MTETRHGKKRDGQSRVSTSLRDGHDDADGRDADGRDVTAEQNNQEASGHYEQTRDN